jgi:hypothetical protein
MTLLTIMDAVGCTIHVRASSSSSSPMLTVTQHTAQRRNHGRGRSVSLSHRTNSAANVCTKADGYGRQVFLEGLTIFPTQLMGSKSIRIRSRSTRHSLTVRYRYVLLLFSAAAVLPYDLVFFHLLSSAASPALMHVFLANNMQLTLLFFPPGGGVLWLFTVWISTAAHSNQAASHESHSQGTRERERERERER